MVKRVAPDALVTPTKRQKTQHRQSSPVGRPPLLNCFGRAVSSPEDKSIYAKARSALRLSALPQDNVLGRDTQRTALYAFLSQHYPTVFPLHDASNDSQAHSVYMAGQPGTGKTVLIHHLLEEPFASGRLNGLILNCTALDDLFATVLEAMSGKTKLRGAKARAQVGELARDQSQPPL
jgi:hypothetical protein